MKKNYLFFYLKTCGGHYAPAKAIAEYLQKYYYQHNAILVDGLENGPNWMSKIIVDTTNQLYRLPLSLRVPNCAAIDGKVE